MNALVAILGLGVLIFVHELGHFVVARGVGMRPRKFYVGFPPALVKTTRNGIEYGLGSIPLGGYVKIPGMHRPAPSDLDLHMHRAVDEAPSLVARVDRVKRALAAGDTAAATELVPPLAAAVDEAELSARARSSAERGLRDLDDALAKDAYWRAPIWKRAAAIAAGPLTNVLFAVILFTGLYMAGGGKPTSEIAAVVPDSPAAALGLQAGDRIVAVAGERVAAEEISQRIRESEGAPLAIVVRRDGENVQLGPGRAQQDPETGAYRLGFQLAGEGLSAPESVWQSAKLTWRVTEEIGRSLARLVTGEGREDIASPVGIVQGSSDALDQGVQEFFWVLGLISLSLALLNLLPLLPLDGGHILFSLIEGLRGKAVGREVYERVSAVGLMLVLLLFFIGLSNDIGRLS